MENKITTVESKIVDSNPMPASTHSSAKSKERRKNDGGHYSEKKPVKTNVTHVCSIRRVSRVMKGGKIMRFSALVIVGDEKGHVGYGMGRSVEVAEAVKKAGKIAERNMIYVPFKQNRTIFHDIDAQYCGAKIYLRSAKKSCGIKAGGTMRYVFEALGIKDVVCKSLGSTNAHNVIKATFQALQNLQTPKKIAKLRNVSVASLFKNVVEVEVKTNE